MNIDAASFYPRCLSVAGGNLLAHQDGEMDFFARLKAAQVSFERPSTVGNSSSALQQSPAASIFQTNMASQTLSQPAVVSTQPAQALSMFFPPGFPADMKEQLTDFFNRSNLSSEDKTAMWSSTVVGLYLMNHGPAGFRRYLTEETRFGSPSFNPVKLIANYGNALATHGHPNIGKAVQDYLRNLGDVG